MQYTNDSPDPKKPDEQRHRTLGMYDRPKTADWPITPAMLSIIVALVIIGLIISYLIFFNH